MREIRVFISSPSDLRRAPDDPSAIPGEPADKRQLVSDVVQALNNRPTLRERYKFIPYLYEELTPPVVGGQEAQKVVDDQMLRPRDTDVVICLFWSRMGTPLTEINPDTKRPYESGTEYEFYDAYRSYKRRRKPIPLVYRYRAPAPHDSDPEQIAKIIAFFDRISDKGGDLQGLWKDFKSPDELRSLIVNDMELLIARQERLSARVRDRLLQPINLLFAAVLVILAIILVVLLTPRVPPLENAPFNVAIAGFALDKGAGISQADAQVLSQAFYTNFKAKLDDVKGELPLAVGVWSPEQVGVVQGTDTKERENNAAALVQKLKKDQNARADIVVYGIIVKQDDNVAVVPEFYVTENWPEISEVFGRFEMNAALSPPDNNQIRLLSSELTNRSQLLSYIAQGIVQLILQRYPFAIKAYTQAYDISLQEPTGQELIYILRANAYLSNYNRIVAVGRPEERDGLAGILENAEKDYTAAVKVNPDYARAQAGLASVLYLKALSKVAGTEDWNKIDPATLDNIEAIYNKALASKDIPQTADISTKAAFGIAQVNTIRFLRGDQAAWDKADKGFKQVIADYNNGANIRVREFAAQAYGAEALLQKQRGNFAEATQNYAKAVELTQLDSRKEIFKQQQLQVTISERRAARDIDGAAKATEDLLKMKLSPDDAAAVLYQLGKMYSEAGRNQESADAYLRATKQNLEGNPSLAATIWAVLGDKYYDLGRLQESIDAYQKALDLDPTNQSHLKKIIDETKAELAKNGSQATAAATVEATP